jgi:hypothetical protein
MQTMRCLAIGISDAPPLDFLQGAVNGAKAFGDWATKLGIPSKVLVDDVDPVGLADVRAALDQLLLGPEKISRLLIYFAGHGLARDAAEDLWLLSQWFEVQRAIAVGGLRRRLERFGIDQITMIGDACRSIANNEDTADLYADPVLDRGPFDRHIPRVDLLRASASFSAAYMVMGREPEDDRCIFSGVLEEALLGAHAAAFEPNRQCITSISLAMFLDDAVKIRAREYGVDLRPDNIPGFYPPDDVYVAAIPATPPALRPWPTVGAVNAMGPSAIAGMRGGKRGWSTRDSAAAVEGVSGVGAPTFFSGPEQVAAARASQQREIVDFFNGYQHEGERPTHFETGAGFALAGTTVRNAYLGHRANAVNVRDAIWWRIVPDDGPLLTLPLPLLVELRYGTWAGAAALPNFVATFTVNEGRVVSLIYRGMYSPEVDRGTENAVAHLRAGALATDAAYDFAANLRDAKEQDPVQGVLAAYIYDAQGDVESVRRTAFYLWCAGIPIPFDIAMLARLRPTWMVPGVMVVDIPATEQRQPRSEKERTRSWTFEATSRVERAVVAGIFPWLRQGWALLEGGDDPWSVILPQLSEIQKELLPTPFTTLTPHGGEFLREIFRRL